MLFELSDFDFNVDSGHSFVKRIRTSLVPEKNILIIWKRNQDNILVSEKFNHHVEYCSKPVLTTNI